MGSLTNSLTVLAERIADHGDTITTEEAAKTSLVLPFFQALGYDVFNPSEFVPEFTADAVGKKGEKVDYAVQFDDEIVMLVECKSLDAKLSEKHLAQLFRYFTVTRAKFAVLTNGRFYQFYTDLEEPNKLDRRPFFSLDLLKLSDAAVSELTKFERGSFDIDRILANAERLKYVSMVKKVLANEVEEPSADWVKLVAGQVHDGRVTASVRETISQAIKSAFKDLVRDQVQQRLSSALEQSSDNDVNPEDHSASDDIVTTEEEIEGMLIIRAIVRDVIDGARVGLRDSKSYCAVLVDDNNRKPLARMHFNRKQWYLGVFDEGAEQKLPINDLNDIYDHSEQLKVAAKRYVE